jgi:SAM-dependent methyltransferase
VREPSCCCYDVEFDARFAEHEARTYRRSGPRRATRALADALAPGDATGLTVLDVGGGVGALHHLLLARGASSAVDVDASAPYLRAARGEAERLGLAGRVEFVHGDFVLAATDVAAADLVGLDRVVCCYPDAGALVSAAAARTRQRLGIVVPPDGRLSRIIVAAANAWQRIRRSSFRMHAHPHDLIVRAAASAGLAWLGTRPVGIWRLLVFERPARPAGSR